MDNSNYFRKLTLDFVKSMGYENNIDENGNLLLFHGTSKKSAESILKSGKFKGYPFFGFDEKTSRQFARHAGPNPEIMELKIDPSALVPTGSYLTAREDGLSLNSQGIWSLYPNNETLTESPLKDPSETWYRGSKYQSHIALRKDKDGNDTEAYGPGLYFTNSYELASKYGKVKAYKINTKQGFFTEKPLTETVRNNLRSYVRSLIKAAPNYQDTLMNFDENPGVALQEAITAMIYGSESMAEMLQLIANDFYRYEKEAFLSKLSEKMTNGIIIKEGEFKILVLYNLKKAREILLPQKDIPPQIIVENVPWNPISLADKRIQDCLIEAFKNKKQAFESYISEKALILTSDKGWQETYRFILENSIHIKENLFISKSN